MHRAKAALAGPLVALVLVTGCAVDDPPPTPSSSGAGERSSPSASHPPSLDAYLHAAKDRFLDSPPTFHGTYEYRSDVGTLRYELWVDWPAFRVAFTAGDASSGTVGRPYVVATLDGKRFGIRDPMSRRTYMTSSLSETPWVFGPLNTFFGDPDPCALVDAVGVDIVNGRRAIRVRCLRFDKYFMWIDRSTGLELRRVVPKPQAHAPRWSGFVHLNLGVDLDQSLFDPRRVGSG